VLVAQFRPELLDHGVHLVFQNELFLLQSDFLEVILICHMMATQQLLELTFMLFVFFDQTAKLGIRGHQMLLDLLLLHHHRAPPLGTLGMGTSELTLTPP
jgi:hypothetical protein